MTEDDFRNWERARGERIEHGSIVLVRTGWEDRWDDFLGGDRSYSVAHPGLDVSSAHFLVSRGVVGVGIDTLDLEPSGASGLAAHRALASAGIWALENLGGLGGLEGTSPFVVVFPWMLWHGSGAPARVFAFVPS